MNQSVVYKVIFCNFCKYSYLSFKIVFDLIYFPLYTLLLKYYEIVDQSLIKLNWLSNILRKLYLPWSYCVFSIFVCYFCSTANLLVKYNPTYRI